MTRIPNKLSGNGSITNAINALIDAVREMSPRESKDSLMERGPMGTTQRPRVTGGGAAQDIPFQIYQTSTWLKYKVKAGDVITTADPIVATGIEVEKTITSGVLRYWFYIEMTSTTAEIKVSATTLTWDSNKIPIGWVDTQTDSATSKATIHQFVRDHIFNPCAGT